MPLALFQESLGVNLHMEYTDGKYSDADAVLRELRYVGIRTVRDNIPQPASWRPPGQGIAALRMLGASGIRFDLVAPGNSDIAQDLRQVNDLLAHAPGSVLSIEGPNEINNAPIHHPGVTDEAAARAFQRTLYAAARHNPQTQSLPVLYLTGDQSVDLLEDKGLADVANTHPYPHGGEQPFHWLERDFSQYFAMFAQPAGAHYPKDITETGYYTLPQSSDWGGVDESTQSSLLMNTFFDAALQGVQHTYVYQLLDAYPDPSGKNNDAHFGLFHLDGSPKLAAWALHNFAGQFPLDPPSAQVEVKATITGLPAATGHALALTMADGSFAVFTWNEAPIWNAATHQPIAVAPIPVEVQVPGVSPAGWSVSYFQSSSPDLQTARSSDGSYRAYVSPFPTALIFRKK